MSATVAIGSGQMSATVSTRGAELQYLADANGRELLWDGDPRFWTGRAPILFPIVGMLNGDEYRIGGTTYAMPKHGFARHSSFDILEQSLSAATFRLGASDETRAIYPFEFQLDIAYSIEGQTLNTTVTIANNGATPMPASLGFHPALRWPLPYGQPRADHDIQFETDEPAPIRRIGADGLLIAEPQPTPVIGNRLALHDDLFVDDALIFDQLDSRRLTYGGTAGPRIAIEFPDLPLLGIWMKPGAGYICIEPWQGIADPAGFSGDIFEKPGIMAVAPGESRQLVMTIGV